MIILSANESSIEVQKWILWMDAQCFPDAEGPGFGAGPPSFHGSYWSIAWDEDGEGVEPLGYAAWRPHVAGSPLHWDRKYSSRVCDPGFLYRAGVLPKARGRGIQKALIAKREEEMVYLLGVSESITYTDPLSIGSMKSMIACGYEPYLPTEETYLCRGFENIGHYVHWRKEL